MKLTNSLLFASLRLLLLASLQLLLLASTGVDGAEEKFVLQIDNDDVEPDVNWNFPIADDHPTVQLTILLRNKAHYLPFFLGLLDRLNYPRQRISLYIRGDHSIDNSTDLMKEWVEKVKHYYDRVDVILDGSSTAYRGQQGPQDWPRSRFDQVINLKEKALENARELNINFLFFVDCDNLLINENVLNHLIRSGKTVVSPMLESSDAYSNFWADISENFYYKSCDEYREIRWRKKVGIFSVPLVHSTLLIDLRKRESVYLSYKPISAYQGPFDDIIIFAFNARRYGVKMWVTNEEDFGQLPRPMDPKQSIDDDFNQFLNLMQESFLVSPPYPTSRYLSPVFPPKDRLGFDKIYVINLERRINRKLRIRFYFDLLGIDGEIVEAVDGKSLTKAQLASMGVKRFPGYKDPILKRDLTIGEVGCFISHYKIWEDVARNGYERVLIFEDDVKFEDNFKSRLAAGMRELDRRPDLRWEFLFLGRKLMNRKAETRVENAEHLVWPAYSYWLIGYALTHTGARKLIEQRPLEKLLPTDEFVPIMYDRHPNDAWKRAFYPRDLVALAIDPCVCRPAVFKGDKTYNSDTEQSFHLKEDFLPEADLSVLLHPANANEMTESNANANATKPTTDGVKPVVDSSCMDVCGDVFADPKFATQKRKILEILKEVEEEKKTEARKGDKGQTCMQGPPEIKPSSKIPSGQKVPMPPGHNSIFKDEL